MMNAWLNSTYILLQVVNQIQHRGYHVLAKWKLHNLSFGLKVFCGCADKYLDITIKKTWFLHGPRNKMTQTSHKRLHLPKTRPEISIK